MVTDTVDGPWRLLEAIAEPNKRSVEKKSSKNWISTERYLDKWLASPPGLATKAMLAKRWCVKDRAVYETCVQCGVEKMRTTDNLFAGNVRGGDIDAWFAKSKSGRESLSNPCKVCWAAKMALRDNDMIGDGYIRNIIMKYQQLHVTLTAEERAAYEIANPTCKKLPTTDGGLRYYREKLELECSVTGGTLPYVQVKGHPLSMSMNRMDVRKGTKKYDRKVDHTRENTRGAYLFANVRQGQTSKGIYTPFITDLSAEWTRVWQDVTANYMKTAEELIAEEDAAIATREQPGVIKHVADTRNDSAKNRENDMTTERIREGLRECRMRCHTSHLLMEVKSGARKVHTASTTTLATSGPTWSSRFIFSATVPSCRASCSSRSS